MIFISFEKIKAFFIEYMIMKIIIFEFLHLIKLVLITWFILLNKTSIICQLLSFLHSDVKKFLGMYKQKISFNATLKHSVIFQKYVDSNK